MLLFLFLQYSCCGGGVVVGGGDGACACVGACVCACCCCGCGVVVVVDVVVVVVLVVDVVMVSCFGLFSSPLNLCSYKSSKIIDSPCLFCFLFSSGPPHSLIMRHISSP